MRPSRQTDDLSPMRRAFIAGMLPVLALGLWLLWESSSAIAAKTKALAALKAEVAQLRSQRASKQPPLATAAEATDAPRELVEPSPPEQTKDPFSADIDALVDKAARLYGKLQQTPGAMIPEMALLTPSDWMTLAEQKQEPSKGMKKILFLTQDHAKFRLMLELRAAYGKWRSVYPQATLADLRQLRPFLNRTVSDAMLSRYELPASQQREQLQLPAHSKSAELLIFEKGPANGAANGRPYYRIANMGPIIAGKDGKQNWVRSMGQFQVIE